MCFSVNLPNFPTAKIFFHMVLSDYACELSVSNKRRCLEKICGIQDLYSIAASKLRKYVLPHVTNKDIFNYPILETNFCTLKWLSYTFIFRTLLRYFYACHLLIT